MGFSPVKREDFRLSTIHESASRRPMANLKGYSKRNIILHLTGGGFFAHTIEVEGTGYFCYLN
jgi:hypothetical protein